jgi:predicted DNA-binding transcriptional regulator AlpA
VIKVGVKGKLYTTGDIADRLGVTRQRAYAIANRKGFPDTFDEWPAGPSVWLVEDVEAWIAANRNERAEDPEGA